MVDFPGSPCKKKFDSNMTFTFTTTTKIYDSQEIFKNIKKKI